jgi:hypothetical protein
MSSRITLSISTEGRIRAIYDDRLAGLLSQGKATIKRASAVEPTTDGQWTAAMVDGPTLGPFKLRQQALDAEVEYLKARLF